MSFVLDVLDLRCQWVIQEEPFKRETDAIRFHKKVWVTKTDRDPLMYRLQLKLED